MLVSNLIRIGASWMLRFFYMLALWELWTLALWMLMLPCSAASGRKESRAVGTWWRPSRCVWRRSLRDHESTEVDRMRPLQWCHQRVSLLLVMRSIHQWSPMVWYYLKYIMYGSYYKYKDMSYIIYGYQMKLQLNKATFCTKKLSKKRHLQWRQLHIPPTTFEWDCNTSTVLNPIKNTISIATTQQS